MLQFNYDNDFKFTIKPKLNDELIDLTKVKDLSLIFKNNIRGFSFTPIWKLTDAGIDIEVQKEMIKWMGVYNVYITYRRSDDTFSDFFQDIKVGPPVFEIVPVERAIDKEDAAIIEISPIFKGDKGDKGDSAYQVWLEEGNTGTEEDYFAYLRQPAIEAGASISELEGAIKVSEGLRASAESERDLRETARNTAESERLSAETIRQSNEDNRIDNEATRVQNEAERISEEGIRQSNEIDRVEAEGLRVQAESERQNTIQEAVTATNLANEKANLANIATQNANTAIINANNARDNIMPSVLNNEEVQAETYNDLNERIIALENLVKEAIYSKITTDTIDVISEIKMKGSPLIYVKDEAPSFAPDQLPQFYIDTAARKLYTARGTSSASDWF